VFLMMTRSISVNRIESPLILDIPPTYHPNTVQRESNGRIRAPCRLVASQEYQGSQVPTTGDS
jgi:hypothetical protein